MRGLRVEPRGVAIRTIYAHVRSIPRVLKRSGEQAAAGAVEKTSIICTNSLTLSFDTFFIIEIS